jgi:hypothetical protein
VGTVLLIFVSLSRRDTMARNDYYLNNEGRSILHFFGFLVRFAFDAN